MGDFLFTSTHASLLIEPWKELPGGIHVAHVDDPEQPILLLRDNDEIDAFVRALQRAQRIASPPNPEGPMSRLTDSRIAFLKENGHWEIRVLAAEVDALRAERDAAEDFRAEIAVESFTAPDADWSTILDSLRSRIAASVARAKKAEARIAAAVTLCEPGIMWVYPGRMRDMLRRALSGEEGP